MPTDCTAPVVDLPLHDTAASREVERSALAPLPPGTLMARAGLAVARLALALAPHARQVWVACGPGHNGGDGLEAALRLRQAGVAVRVGLWADETRLPAEALASLRRARDAGVPIDPAPARAPEGTALVIDALLGLGLTRPVLGPLAAAIAACNDAQALRLAVDLPSGLHGDTGCPTGEAVVQAHHTLALLTLKPGLYTGHGRDLAGKVWFDDLGVHDALAAVAPQAWLTGRRTAEVDARPHATHKGSRGDVIVIGGATGMAGAADLAARASLAAGAGRVYLCTLDDRETLDPVRPELMRRPGLWQAEPDRLAAATVVCGCGGGQAVVPALPVVLERSARLVLDADGLNAIARDGALRALLARRGEAGHPTVLTPHPLEAARLLGVDAATVQRDRLRHAQALAEATRAVVVLKGSGTIIAAPGRAPFLNPTGGAALATAGTGDVLAGWLGGVLAPGHGVAAGTAPGHWQRLAAAAVHRHGAAADAHCRDGPLLAADLVDAMASVGPAPPAA